AAVSDDALTSAVSALRKALGDSARQPEFVRTLPRVGYTLVTPVRREAGDYLDRSQRSWRSRVQFAVGLLTLALVGGVAAWHRAPEAVDWQPPQSSRARIAVLPFVDRSSAPGESYLADALSEALTTRLARGGDFHVLSWRTARLYRDTDLPLATLAEELDLHAVLEGSLQTDGPDFRLQARLVDVRGDDHLLAETYERPLAELQAMEEDLIRKAEAALRHRAGLPGHRTPLPSPASPKVAPSAYREYLQGRYFRHREAEADLAQAVLHFRRAVAIDPSFAAAHAALAETYFLQTEAKGLSRAAGLELGSAAAREAVRLDPELGAAHAVDAIVKFCLAWDFVGAERSFQAFLDRPPQDPVFIEWYIRYLNVTQRFDEALTQWRRIAEIDPASYSDLGPVRTLILARRYTEAQDHLDEIRQLEPDNPMLQPTHALLAELAGDEDEAALTILDGFDQAGWPAEKIAAAHTAYRDQGLQGVFSLLEEATEPAFEKAALRARMGDRE
ncbi:MAG: hypothetical protein AAF657_42020, partial [Acidobacteriota bacterium]